MTEQTPEPEQATPEEDPTPKVESALAEGFAVHVDPTGTDTVVMAAESDLPEENDSDDVVHQVVQQTIPSGLTDGDHVNDSITRHGEEQREHVALPNVVADMFGMSPDAALLMIRTAGNEVTIDGEQVKVKSGGLVPLEDVDGKEVVIKGDHRTVSFTYNAS